MAKGISTVQTSAPPQWRDDQRPAIQGRAAPWIGRALSGLVVAFLVPDGAIERVPIGPVTQTPDQSGYGPSPALARGLGVLTLACTALSAIPRTAPLGAILLTGYLGPMVRGGLLLRDARQ